MRRCEQPLSSPTAAYRMFLTTCGRFEYCREHQSGTAGSTSLEPREVVVQIGFSKISRRGETKKGIHLVGRQNWL